MNSSIYALERPCRLAYPVRDALTDALDLQGLSTARDLVRSACSREPRLSSETYVASRSPLADYQLYSMHGSAHLECTAVLQIGFSPEQPDINHASRQT